MAYVPNLSQPYPSLLGGAIDPDFVKTDTFTGTSGRRRLRLYQKRRQGLVLDRVGKSADLLPIELITPVAILRYGAEFSASCVGVTGDLSHAPPDKEMVVDVAINRDFGRNTISGPCGRDIIWYPIRNTVVKTPPLFPNWRIMARRPCAPTHDIYGWTHRTYRR